MTAIWAWITGAVFSAIADLTSVLSLGITIWVALAVRRLKASYLFSARAPQLVKQLRGHATSLAECLNDFEASEDKIREELAAAEVTAFSLARKMDWRRRGTVKQLAKAIRRVSKSQLSKAELRAIYVQLVKVNEHVKDLHADLKWER